MRNEVRSSRFFPILQLTVLSLLFSGIYLLIEFGIGAPHEVSVFISFLVLPFAFLSFPSSSLSFLYPHSLSSRSPHSLSSRSPHSLSSRSPHSLSSRSPHFLLSRSPHSLSSRSPHSPSDTPTSLSDDSPPRARTLIREFRSLGGFDLGFLEGILIYLVFTGWVFVYYLNDKDFFTGYAKTGWEVPVFLFLVALNVMPVDFFTKRFIQAPLSRQYGPGIAVCLQTFVWLAAHIPESLWLDELMGSVGVWIFLLFTGLVTGISYERTKNVSGMMAGHVMINAFVVLMARL